MERSCSDLTPNGTVMSVQEKFAPLALFKPRPFSFSDATSQFAVSADGQTFYLLESVAAPADTLRVITQWDAGLR